MLSYPLIVGYHGCDYDTARKVVSSQESLQPSENKYDWLGHGIYFWEDDCERALQWANHVKDHPDLFHKKVTHPFVVGALISPKNCLDLTQTESRKILKFTHKIVNILWGAKEIALPINKPAGADDQYLLQRNLDCLICNFIGDIRRAEKKPDFDLFRAPFLEGESLYEGSAFKDKTHTQLCVRDPSCILGYFIPTSLRNNLPQN